MVQQFLSWLGPTRKRLLIGLLIITGLGSLFSLVLASDEPWSEPLQTVFMLVFLGGTGVIVG
ncbi:MAG: hypothetical protein F9K46_16135, partial [Anaerolineae bacterium]